MFFVVRIQVQVTTMFNYSVLLLLNASGFQLLPAISRGLYWVDFLRIIFHVLIRSNCLAAMYFLEKKKEKSDFHAFWTTRFHEFVSV